MVGATATVVVGTVAALWLVPSASADDVPANAIRAASYAAMQGVQTENTSDTGGGKSVGWLSDGDWMRFDDVNLGPAGAGRMSLRYSAAYQDRTGLVELRADSVNGPLLSTVPITGTGGWGAWKTATAGSQSPGGKHQVFLVMKSTQKMDFVNLNWFALSGSVSASSAPASNVPAPSSPFATAPSTMTSSATTPSATTPSTTTPSSTTPTAGTPSQSALGWIDVNLDAWRKQLADFEALPDRPRPNVNVHSEFNAACDFGHDLQDDPIVLPGLPGASHMHSIVGNNSLNAFSTADSLRAYTGGSSCGPIGDKSAYWMPRLQVTHKDGAGKIVIDKVIEPRQTIVYYGNLTNSKNPMATKPIPFGLRIIVGNAKDDRDMSAGEGNQFYCTRGEPNGDPDRGNNGRNRDGNWPLCEDDPGNKGGGTYHWFVRFPNCWDGKHLDSPNHKDHMAYDQDGACPAAFPIQLPSVSFSVAYPTFGEENMALASGRPSTMHADAFFAWDDAAMARRVKYCAIPSVECDEDNPYPETGQYE